MPISSLIVTLATELTEIDHTLATLRATPGVTLGPCIGRRVALVLETASLAEGREAVEGRIADIVGVHHIDVIWIGFEDLDFDTCNDDDS